MTMQERVTAAVVVVLMLVGGWFGWTLWSAGGLWTARVDLMIAAVFFIAVLSAVLAAAAALMGEQRVDERDRKITFQAQGLRGYLYLVLAYAALVGAIVQGAGLLANALFAAILAIELLSGLVMLALYRRAA